MVMKIDKSQAATMAEKLIEPSTRGDTIYGIRTDNLLQAMYDLQDALEALEELNDIVDRLSGKALT